MEVDRQLHSIRPASRCRKFFEDRILHQTNQQTPIKREGPIAWIRRIIGLDY